MSEIIYRDGLGTITGRKDEITGSIIIRVDYQPSKYNNSVLSSDSITIPDKALEHVELFLNKMRWNR